MRNDNRDVVKTAHHAPAREVAIPTRGARLDLRTRVQSARRSDANTRRSAAVGDWPVSGARGPLLGADHSRPSKKRDTTLKLATGPDVDELKARLRAYNEAHSAIAEAWRRRDYQFPPPCYPNFPEECRGLTCGAKTRKGTPCRRVDLYLSGRCRLHGGLSTGPRTVAGKRRAAANLRRAAPG